MTLGERLHDLRKNKKIRQQELADKLNLSKSTISYWETNKHIPKYTTIQALANILETTTDYLTGATNDPLPPKTDPLELYNKLIADNQNLSIHFYDVENLNEHDLEIIQNTIDTLKAKNILKEENK